jgi:predicted negative regulator of RcsB-dependent stress response
MTIDTIVLTGSILIMFILLAVLVSLAFRLNSPPHKKQTKKVSSDLKKIKEQINQKK